MSLFTRRRRMRVHFLPNAAGELADFEGVFAGRTGDCYLLLAPKMLQSDEASFTLDNAIEIPRSTVWFMERL